MDIISRQSTCAGGPCIHSSTNPCQATIQVAEPFPSGLAEPFGHCNDGRAPLLVGRGRHLVIARTDPSLDADLYKHIPAEGIPGVAIYLWTQPLGLPSSRLPTPARVRSASSLRQLSLRIYQGHDWRV